MEKFVGKAKQNADVHVMMVPTKSWILREKLPAFAPHYKEQRFYDALQQKLEKEDVLISVEPVLDAHKEEEIYYRTDHHWTTLGAWYAYEHSAFYCYSLLGILDIDWLPCPDGVSSGQKTTKRLKWCESSEPQKTRANLPTN